MEDTIPVRMFYFWLSLERKKKKNCQQNFPWLNHGNEFFIHNSWSDLRHMRTKIPRKKPLNEIVNVERAGSMQAYLRWLRPDELRRFSLCVELAVDWFIAGNMDNCNKRGERFLKFQFGEIIEGFIGGKREITVAIWCHCKRWRNDPLGNGGDILQSDFIYCLQEMLQRLPEKITRHTSAVNIRALIHPMRVCFLV